MDYGGNAKSAVVQEYEEYLGEPDGGRMLSYLQNIFFRPSTDSNVSVSQHAFVVKHTQAKQMVKIILVFCLF